MTEIPIEQIPFKEIALLILGTLSTFLVWRVQHQKDKIRNVESQLSDKKYQMYSELIYILFDITNGEKVGKKVSQRDLLKRILAIKRDMFIYAPDEIFKKFTKWTLEINKVENSMSQFKTYFELMKLVRKDMGQKNTKLDLDDFMLFYMQSEEEYQVLKEQNGW
ncbi:hypothetical protein [Maribacter sp.]|uniref:hypothetical protein n=1 Tax=Maribacter sp. TaxID=1897614 RepID=UPI0025C5555D|nr:hypothetical protein [Maribacter sp.]